MLKFPSPRKSEGMPWIFGPDVEIDPAQVASIEPREHRTQSWSHGQAYTLIHLAGGQTIEVLVDAATVGRQLEQAKAKFKPKNPPTIKT